MFIQLIQMQQMLGFRGDYSVIWMLLRLLRINFFTAKGLWILKWKDRVHINNSQNNHIFGTTKFFIWA